MVASFPSGGIKYTEVPLTHAQLTTGQVTKGPHTTTMGEIRKDKGKGKAKDVYPTPAEDQQARLIQQCAVIGKWTRWPKTIESTK